MDVTFDRQKLVDALQAVSPAVSSRSGKQVLQYVHLAATDEGARLTATDSELRIRRWLKIEDMAEQGVVLLPPQRLLAIVRSIRAEQVRLRCDATRHSHLMVGDGGSRWELQTADASDWPGIDRTDWKMVSVVSAGGLAKLLRSVSFATCSGSSRYALHGVLVIHDPCYLRAVATDGRRLAMAHVSTADSVRSHARDSNTIWPRHLVNALGKIMPGGSSAGPECEVLLAKENNRVMVRVPGEMEIDSLLLEGRFPKWQDVLPPASPRESDGQLEGPAGSLASANTHAAVVLDAESRGVDWVIDPTDQCSVTLSAAAETGRSQVRAICQASIRAGYERAAVSLDHRYVTEGLRAIAGDQVVTMHFYSAKGMAEFFLPWWRYVVMGMAVDGGKDGGEPAA